jgi:sodium-dependent dicarboxylate transporter 2/3/5
MTDATSALSRFRGLLAVLVGPCAAVVAFFIVDDPAMAATASLFALAGTWWISEALHPAQTALVVIAAAPVIGACTSRQAFAALGNPILFLFVGSFMLAEAMRLHGLGERIARFMTRRIRSELGALAALSAAAFLLSMWISNAAATAIVLPMALSISSGSAASVRRAMVLSVAWGASMGGLCTPVGTPPNLIAIRALAERDVDLSFMSFLMVGTPIGVVMWFSMVAVLAVHGGVHRRPLPPQLKTTSPWSSGEVAAAVAFFFAVIGWVAPGMLQLFDVPGAAVIKARLSEEVVAVLAAGLLFVWPLHTTDGAPRRALAWSDAVDIDWGTVILFGAGVLLGELANSSGLARAWGQALIDVSGASSSLAVIALVVVVAVLLSEVASNTAAATLVVPVGLGLADVTGTSPVAVALAAALASSFGFMMPISTAPNAMAYGTGLVTMRQMVRSGVVFDVIGVVIVIAGVLVLSD